MAETEEATSANDDITYSLIHHLRVLPGNPTRPFDPASPIPETSTDGGTEAFRMQQYRS
jgi:hypothetical protein